MQWERRSAYCQCSDLGHKVSAIKVHGAWLYEAWGPADAPELSDFAWHAHRAREHYALGEHVARRHPFLGFYPSAAEAKAACESDAARAAGE